MKRIVLLVAIGVLRSASSRGQIDKDFKQSYVSAWSKLIPTQLKIQYAGDMGFLSLGPGWDLGKKRRWEINTFVGFIRETNVSPTHITFTLKQTYKPFRVSLGEKFELEPLTAGFYINKVFGQYFWQRLPDRYPKGYYFWALNTRFNVFLGEAITFRFSKYLSGDTLSLFYEFNTNDLYIISAINNDYLNIMDIINLSFGVKFTFL